MRPGCRTTAWPAWAFGGPRRADGLSRGWTSGRDRRRPVCLVRMGRQQGRSQSSVGFLYRWWWSSGGPRLRHSRHPPDLAGQVMLEKNFTALRYHRRSLQPRHARGWHHRGPHQQRSGCAVGGARGPIVECQSRRRCWSRLLFRFRERSPLGRRQRRPSDQPQPGANAPCAASTQAAVAYARSKGVVDRGRGGQLWCEPGRGHRPIALALLRSAPSIRTMPGRAFRTRAPAFRWPRLVWPSARP